MNFKSRIRKLEYELSKDWYTGIPESRLYEESFKYKGNPFNSMEELFEGLNVTNDFSPYYTANDYIKLFEKGLLSYESEEMQSVKKEIAKQMTENM